MKILHVTNHFYPCVGGIEKNVLDLCEQLIKRGHVSDVMCLNRCSDGRKLAPRGKHGKIRIFRVPFIDMKYYKVGRGVLGRVREYDIIHVHGLGYFFDLLAMTKHVHGKRIILSTHGGFFHTKNLSLLKKIHFRTFTRLSLKSVDRVVAVSKQDFERFSGVSERIEYIPNGIDFGRFQGNAEKDEKMFVYVGRIAKNKRIDNLAKAFRVVCEGDRKTRLYILGDDFDGLVPGLEKMVRGWGLERNIVFKGNVSEKEKLECLAKSGFFVSASEYEGFGISVLEGMASGCIPIVNNIKPFKDILGGEGFLVDYSNPEEAGRFILGAEQSAGLSKNARMAAKGFDWKECISKMNRVYEELPR